MILSIITLAIVSFALATIYTYLYLQAMVIITPVKGLMFGVCYNDDEYEDEIEHSIQLSLGIIIITTIWVTN